MNLSVGSTKGLPKESWCVFSSPRGRRPGGAELRCEIGNAWRQIGLSILLVLVAIVISMSPFGCRFPQVDALRRRCSFALNICNRSVDRAEICLDHLPLLDRQRNALAGEELPILRIEAPDVNHGFTFPLADGNALQSTQINERVINLVLSTGLSDRYIDRDRLIEAACCDVRQSWLRVSCRVLEFEIL